MAFFDYYTDAYVSGIKLWLKQKSDFSDRLHVGSYQEQDAQPKTWFNKNIRTEKYARRLILANPCVWDTLIGSGNDSLLTTQFPSIGSIPTNIGAHIYAVGDYGPFGKCTSFQMVETTSAPYFTLPRVGLTTFEGCWETWIACRGSSPTDFAGGNLFSLYSEPDPAYGINLWSLKIQSGVFRLSRDNSNYVTYTIPSHIVSFTWFHVAFVWDYAAAIPFRLYIDGVPLDSASVVGTPYAEPHHDFMQYFFISDNALLASGLGSFFAMQNLKIWNFAKNNFDDRFVPFAADMSKVEY